MIFLDDFSHNPLFQFHQRLLQFPPHKLVRVEGHITEASAAGYRVCGLSNFLTLGGLVSVQHEDLLVPAEVIRLEANSCLIRAFSQKIRFQLNTAVYPAGALTISPDNSWRGRMINALAEPVDSPTPLIQGSMALSLDHSPPNAMQRGLIEKPLQSGVRAIDIFTPLCYGQRIGIFAGSGVGKSTLLSMLSNVSGFDTVVMVLVGERGREVREFAESPHYHARARMVTVVATGDESPLMRRLAPRTGMRLAEFFRDQGDQVLLVMDSVTRYAHACRDVALAAGEAPVARGYPPSVFSDLPLLLERAGPGIAGTGAITGLFSVLVDGDDHNDPVADAIRGTLDGHLVLSRKIAEQGRYPAIDLLGSISRLSQLAWREDQRKLVRMLQALVARYEDSRDLRTMGGYQPGADPELDRAVHIIPKLYQSLSQTPDMPASLDAFAEVAAQLAP